MQPFDLFCSLNYLKPLISSIQFQNYIILYIIHIYTLNSMKLTATYYSLLESLSDIATAHHDLCNLINWRQDHSQSLSFFIFSF